MKAFHFCRGVDEWTRTARGLINGIAFQLACSLPAAFEAIQDAAAALQEQEDIGGAHVTTAFSRLLEEPLCGVAGVLGGSTKTIVIGERLPATTSVLPSPSPSALFSPSLSQPPPPFTPSPPPIPADGVDEMPPRERSLLLGLEWEALPIRTLFLSRDAAVSTLRGRATWVDLQQYRAELEQDVDIYAREQLDGWVAPEELEQAARALVHHSGKSFLYMRMICGQVKSRGGMWTAQELWSLPANLDDIFEEDLRRVYDGLEVDMKQRVESLLSIMAATSEPIRINEAADLITSTRTGEPLRPSDIHSMLYRLHVSLSVLRVAPGSTPLPASLHRASSLAPGAPEGQTGRAQSPTCTAGAGGGVGRGRGRGEDAALPPHVDEGLADEQGLRQGRPRQVQERAWRKVRREERGETRGKAMRMERDRWRVWRLAKA